MSIEQNPNLDPETRMQLRVIELEKNLENLTKRWLENDVSLMTELREWENRVKVLEEARQKQIVLNATFAKPAPKEPATTHTIWDLFKRK